MQRICHKGLLSALGAMIWLMDRAKYIQLHKILVLEKKKWVLLGKSLNILEVNSL